MQDDTTWQKEWIEELNRSYGLELAENLGREEALALLAEKLNALIQSDFSMLVQLLYRIDVSESRLQTLLRTETGEDAGLLIARLILERQQQKMLTRRQFRTGPPATDEERW